ncbi:porphobilinogen deaminase [Kalmusia sp. IMI 367209]|nr:porphobilinogen deaminase [Kalmusia sp. IMI 367209]
MASATAKDLPAPSQSAPQGTNTSASTQFSPIKIGTRRSALAQVQARWVEQELKKVHPDGTYEICPVLAQGDKDKVTPLQILSQGENAKSLWTGELEALLEDGELDMIQHCLKDMPTQLPEKLTLGVILEREDPRDVLIVSPHLPKNTTLASLPPGSTIGTSSIRRSAQLRRLYPELKFADLRGNIGTRLAKLDAEDSQYAAIILAAAGIKRMGWESRITQYLTSSNGGMLHAVGQGALALEIRKDDEAMQKLVSKIKCEKTTRACSAERALLRALEGGCSVPIGVETSWRGGKGLAVGIQPPKDFDKHGQPIEEPEPDLDDQELVLKTLVVSVDGKESVEYETARKVRSTEEAEEMGRDVARILLSKGADKILENISKEKLWAAKKQQDDRAAAS